MRVGKLSISFKGAAAPQNTINPSSYDGSLKYFTPLNGFSWGGGNASNIDTKTVEGQRDAYVYCPAITAIVNQKVAIASGAKFIYTNAKGEITNSKFSKLTDKPSPEISDWTQFFQLLYTLALIHGKAYIYKRKLAGISQPEYYIIPNWQLSYDISTNDFWGKRITKYYWTRNEQQISIMPEDVIIISDTGFDLSNNDNYFIGQSRLIPLKDAVRNIISAYECRGQMMDNGGPPMIISPQRDTTGRSIMMPDDKDTLERDLGTSYGWRKGRKKILVAQNPITATKVGVNASDLAGFEEVQEDFKECCRAYGAGLDYIFGLDRTTFNNLSEAKKILIQNSIMPEVASILKQVTYGFSITDNYSADFSHFEELQKNEKDKVEVFTSIANGLKPLVEAGFYTVDEARTILEANTNIIIE